eukprot:TRINITY_DN183_c0_g1_i1.p1 TRINITY_DN183_c0_g1~~TRINITY_DN183_c0_g1_i1.p1  ORF type:complete len:709 (-),score=167.44 TRINITY_DN183_c0_g1_i1:242-2320(-)
MKVTTFLACGLLAAAAEITWPQPEMPRRLWGSLRGASAAKGHRLEQDVKAPLRAAATAIKEEVSKLLFLAAKNLRASSENHSEIPASTVAIRKLVADVVPKVLKIRDVSSAVDQDPRPKNTSQAALVQTSLAAMQQYWELGWPVTIQQVEAAFGDMPTLLPRVERGINDSLTFLEPVLKQAWNTEKFLIPVVKDLVSDVGNSSVVMLGKASCSSSFAEGLGDLTSVYAQLAEAQDACVAQSDAMACAQELVAALAHVAGSTSQGSTAMWECFGIDWECSRIVSSALEHLMQALSSSLEISFGCKMAKASCSLRRTFAAYGDLWRSAAALELAANLGSCSLKESNERHALNPYAATPADLKAPSSSTSAESTKDVEGFEKLPLLAKVSGAADTQLSVEVANIFSRVSASIEKLLQRTLAKATEAIQSKNTSGLVNLADDVLDVMGANVRRYLGAVNETSALSEQRFKDGPGLKQRQRAQQDIITMMEFTISNAPKIVSEIVEGGNGVSMRNEDFFAQVNEKVQKARSFFSEALEDAWEGLRLQLPRSDDVTESLDWAGCAAVYAGSLGQLTSLYSSLASTGADCQSEDEFFEAGVCESDLLTDFSSIQHFVTTASSMMQTCGQGSWPCMQSVSSASKAMLSTLTEAISIKANCESSDMLNNDNCKSLALSLLGNFVAAADAVDASKLECKRKP